MFLQVRVMEARQKSEATSNAGSWTMGEEVCTLQNTVREKERVISRLECQVEEQVILSLIITLLKCSLSLPFPTSLFLSLSTFHLLHFLPYDIFCTILIIPTQFSHYKPYSLLFSSQFPQLPPPHFTFFNSPIRHQFELIKRKRKGEPCHCHSIVIRYFYLSLTNTPYPTDDLFPSLSFSFLLSLLNFNLFTRPFTPFSAYHFLSFFL